jgi:sortase A
VDKQPPKRIVLYGVLGTLLLSIGSILGCLLSSRVTRAFVESRVAQRSTYLVIARTPTRGLPSATPLPTATVPPPTTTPTAMPTATPTATPPPLPPIRLSIPAIGLNTTVVETYPTKTTLWTGEEKFVWQSVSFAVGHYDTSGNPGEGRNIVLAGHNNTQGAVFRRLPELERGQQVLLYTEKGEFRYRVTEKTIVPYLGSEEEGDAMLRAYAAPQSAERVTMISCWPYATNAHRIVVVAEPFPEETQSHGD